MLYAFSTRPVRSSARRLGTEVSKLDRPECRQDVGARLPVIPDAGQMHNDRLSMSSDAAPIAIIN